MMRVWPDLTELGPVCHSPKEQVNRTNSCPIGLRSWLVLTQVEHQRVCVCVCVAETQHEVKRSQKKLIAAHVQSPADFSSCGVNY